MKKIRVGIVGFGISAKVFHIPFLLMLEEFELVAIVERKMQEAPKAHPAVNVYSSLEEMLEDKSIELIVITTPNDTHFPFADKCLSAGRHVVLEKPFTNTIEEAQQLVERAHNSRGILSVYQNRRYVSDYFTIKEIVDKKLLGEIHEFGAHYDRYRAEARPNAWREAALPGSGIFYDLGPHLIDQVFSLFGIPKAVTADIRKQRPHARVDDYFMVWLDYDFGKVILHAGMLIREPGPRYMIHGTKGSFIKYGEDVQEAKLRAGQSPDVAAFGEEPADIYGLLHTEHEGKIIKEKYRSLPGDYAGYYRNIYNTIRNNAPLREKPEHGFNTIRLIMQAMESNEKRCTVECSGYYDVGY
jgi:scyllo-inositol 2-dehydrogenase (NADP+)